MDSLATKSIVGSAQFIGALGILLFVPAWRSIAKKSAVAADFRAGK
jgi:hypothetical protein